MFDGWGDFYFLTGSAAGGLIGLLFVVMTLTSNMERSTVLVGTSLYTSPVLLHFALVLVLSAAALAPAFTPHGLGLIGAERYRAVRVLGIGNRPLRRPARRSEPAGLRQCLPNSSSRRCMSDRHLAGPQDSEQLK